MIQKETRNIQIFKNTALLYFRMFVMLVVSLFTSRVILHALGEEDYGIYNIVGGVVVSFSFVSSALMQATQRFLNYAIGKENDKEAREVFCMSVNSYVFLSILFVILAESIGLWFVNTQLNIPSNRMYATNWVYQLVVITFVANLIRVPYNAAIIAYERMDFFAYLSLFEVFSKLLVVYLLYIGEIDKLILFSFLYTIIPIFITCVYQIYCNKHFNIAKYYFVWKRDTFVKLFSFSCWSLFGSLASMAASQGLNILANIFYGVSINAALGIANQINAKVIQFVSNFRMAFNPQIVKRYASNEMDSLHNLVFTASKFSYFLLLIISEPIIIKMDCLLNVWLIDVPQYTTIFCQLILLFSLIEALAGPLWMYVQATGDIKKYQLLMSVLLFLNLPLIYFVLKSGFPVYYIWVVRIVVDIVIFSVRCLYLKTHYNFPIIDYLHRVLVPIIVITLFAFPLPMYLSHHIENQWINILITFTIAIGGTLLIIYIGGLDTRERIFLRNLYHDRIASRFK